MVFDGSANTQTHVEVALHALSVEKVVKNEHQGPPCRPPLVNCYSSEERGACDSRQDRELVTSFRG